MPHFRVSSLNHYYILTISLVNLSRERLFIVFLGTIVFLGGQFLVSACFLFKGSVVYAGAQLGQVTKTSAVHQIMMDTDLATSVA